MSQDKDRSPPTEPGADGGRAMIGGPLAMFLLFLGLVLLAGAVLRWRENGWTGLVWLGALIGMFMIRTPHSLRNRANVIARHRKDETEFALLAVMFLTAMVLPLIWLCTGTFGYANYDLPGWAGVIGALAQAPFLWLFWRSHADLGRNWSPGLEVREDHLLVTQGVYSRIRHPMYAAIWISSLAQPLLIQNWIAGFLVVPAFLAMWLIRIPREEAMMKDEFGADWSAYAETAGRLLPRLRR